MSSLEVLEPLFKFLPEVKSPVHNEDFNEKLKWTALILVLYYFLTQIPLYGLSAAAVDQFAALRAVMAGNFGSILTLGIGPIVTASIVLQLLVGSNLLDLDLSSHKDKSLFQATQKLLSIVFTYSIFLCVNLANVRLCILFSYDILYLITCFRVNNKYGNDRYKNL